MRRTDCFTLTQVDEETVKSGRVPLSKPEVWPRAECGFVDHIARVSHSADGKRYTGINESCMPSGNQAGFPSAGCSLCSYTTQPGAAGGHADFDSFLVTWP